MTDNEQATSLLHQAAGAIPVGRPPLEDLVRQGRRAKRRRTMGVVAGAAVAVLLVGGGTTWAVGGLNASSTPGGPAATGRTSPPPTELPTPLGTRLVGINGIGVAVPSAWSTNRAVCTTAFENTVIVGVPNSMDCNLVVGEVSSVALEPYDFMARHRGGWHPTGSIGVVPIQRIATESLICGEHCKLYVGAILVKSRDVTIRASSPHRAEVDRILSSAFLVPSGYGAIPADPTQAELLQRGFEVHVRHLYRPQPFQGTLLGTTPAVGSVATKGSRVTFVLSTKQRSGHCGDLRLTLATPNSQLPIPLRQQPVTLHVHVHVGALVRVVRSGECSKDVQVEVHQPPSFGGRFVLNESPAPGYVVAGAPGKASLLITLPMCDLPGCQGGTYVVATVQVQVDPAR